MKRRPKNAQSRSDGYISDSEWRDETYHLQPVYITDQTSGVLQCKLDLYFSQTDNLQVFAVFPTGFIYVSKAVYYSILIVFFLDSAFYAFQELNFQAFHKPNFKQQKLITTLLDYTCILILKGITIYLFQMLVLNSFLIRIKKKTFQCLYLAKWHALALTV